MLVTSDYTFDQDLHEFQDDITNEASGSGYTAGGTGINNKSVTVDTANDLAYFDGDNTFWNNVSITFRGVVLYKDTGTPSTSPLICFLDYEEGLEFTNDDLTLVWQSDGIFQLT